MIIYTADDVTPIAAPPLANGFTFELFRPTLLHPNPPGSPFRRVAPHMVIKALGMHGHADYRIAVIRRGAELVHYLVATPPYYRFPFMAKNDIQIGDVTTVESARGHSLAAFSVAETIRQMRKPGRRFWYLVEEDNTPSIRVAVKVGLVKSGTAIQKPRFGVRLLGTYQIGERASGPQ